MSIDRRRLTELFLELIKIDGVSRNERHVADFIKEFLERLGLEVYEDNVAPDVGGNAGNIIAHIPGTHEGGIPVAFFAHMDTVSKTAGVQPEIGDGVIRSRGDTILGADDRAGIAVLLEVTRLLEERRVPHGPISLAFTVAEEVGTGGAVFLDTDWLSGKAVFVLDSSDRPGTMVNRTAACKVFSIAVQGKAAHAGVEPEKGVDAIHAASMAIAQLRLGRIDNETTANIGLISGGAARNVVPELVAIEGEVRSLDYDKLDKTLAGILSSFRILEETHGVEVDIQSSTSFEMVNIEPTDPVLRLGAKGIRDCGLEPSLVTVGGGSDANALAAKGINAVNLGIGYRNVHSSSESIAVEDLCSVAEIVLSIIQNAQHVPE